MRCGRYWDLRLPTLLIVVIAAIEPFVPGGHFMTTRTSVDFTHPHTIQIRCAHIPAPDILASQVPIARRIAMALITGYQRYISPHKGFSCAHRVVHGGLSCSEYVKRALLTHGFKDGSRLTRQRFAECAAAARSLREQRLHERLLRKYRLPTGRSGFNTRQGSAYQPTATVLPSGPLLLKGASLTHPYVYGYHRLYEEEPVHSAQQEESCWTRNDWLGCVIGCMPWDMCCYILLCF
jgi:putative component of membrane protein insertase Oxa1/YidC/SpoIIIJ protein YidD